MPLQYLSSKRQASHSYLGQNVLFPSKDRMFMQIFICFPLIYNCFISHHSEVEYMGIFVQIFARFPQNEMASCFRCCCGVIKSVWGRSPLRICGKLRAMENLHVILNYEIQRIWLDSKKCRKKLCSMRFQEYVKHTHSRDMSIMIWKRLVHCYVTSTLLHGAEECLNLGQE